MLFTCIGLGASGLTLFYLPVASELGFTQSAFSLYYTIATVASMVAMAVFGGVLNKHFKHVRAFMLIGAVLTMMCFLGYAFSSKLWLFYVISVFRGIVGVGFSALPATMLINNWFKEKRALATSIVFAGSGFGGMFYTQISSFLITNYGWRAAYGVLGIISLITIIIAVQLVKPDPAAVGLLPYGKDVKEDGQPDVWGLTFKQILFSPVFWFSCIALALGSIVVMGVQQGIAPALVTDHGFSGGDAALVYSTMLIVLCGGKLIFGWIYDKFGFVFSVVYVGITVGLSLFFLTLSGNPGMAYCFAVLFGLGNMTATILAASLTSSVFGTRDYGTKYGIVNMFCVGGMSLGPLLTSYVFDVTGAYRNAWFIYIGITAIVTMILIFVGLRQKNILSVSGIKVELEGV